MRKEATVETRETIEKRDDKSRREKVNQDTGLECDVNDTGQNEGTQNGI